ncbi:MAG: hypothetical protein QJR11_09325 [Fulvimonas sp.]|nr:hypothetical protein [Fulvimonas sp.]
MLISPPFLSQSAATTPDEDFLAMTLLDQGFGQGAFPLGHDMSWHGGLHLRAPKRDAKTYEPVRAIADGTVAYVRQPKAKPDKPEAVEADPLGYNGWTDNGCVIIEHTTEIGEGLSVTFYSIMLHLKQLAPDLAKGEKIWRKDEVGEAGCIDGVDHQIHFEIICDDAQLANLVGRAADPLDPQADGRSTALFGEVYVALPAGTPFYAEAPDATVAHVPSPIAPVHATQEDYLIGLRCTHVQGDVLVTTYRKDGSVVGEPLREAGADHALYDRAIALAAAHRAAGTADPPSASALQQLLRLGRVADGQPPLATDVPHWRKAAYPGGQGWVNLHAPGVRVFSDADWPPWRGWRLIGDDRDLDSRCHADTLLQLILQDDEADQPLAQLSAATDVDHQAKRLRQAQSRMSDPAMLERLSGVIAKFTTEWSASDLTRRWQWLTQETPPEAGPLAGPYLTEEDFARFQAHGQALCFWEEAKLGLDARHWHFHPAAFIGLFRRCGWLSHEEMLQLFPRTAMRPAAHQQYVSEAIIVSPRTVENYRVALNKACRRHGIDTPLRMAAFYANAMQETQWFLRITERPSGQRYTPWNGRGFLQLTWPSNYIKYWRYMGKPVDEDLSSRLLTAQTQVAYRHAHHLMPENEPLTDESLRVPKEIQDRRDAVGTQKDESAESACAYWAWSHAAIHADTEPVNLRAFKTVDGQSKVYYTCQGMGCVAATVNVGQPSANYAHINGIVARFQAYTTGQVVLLDTPMFPDAQGQPQPLPENYQPRRP